MKRFWRALTGVITVAFVATWLFLVWADGLNTDLRDNLALTSIFLLGAGFVTTIKGDLA